MKKLGEYEVLKEIGRGRFATVYKARHTTKHNCIVALKVMHPELTTEPESIERFKQAAYNATGLDHPHIVRIFEFSEEAGQFYIAMEMACGSSLAKHIQQHGPVPWEEALDILEQIASALDYIHERGLVHRNVKPSNILLDLEKGVLLGGFGLSKAVRTLDFSLTTTDNALGTVNYVAPEIWKGEQAVPASDVYALGCVFYEMVTGNVLFDADSPWAVMKLHETGPQLGATKLEKGYRKILLKALEKLPHRRYQRAGEFVAALRGAGKRPIIFGDILQRLRTRRNWAYAALGLTALLIVAAALLCWPLGEAGKPGDQPSSISANTLTTTATATSMPALTATATSTHTPTATTTHTAIPSPSPSLAPTATRLPTHTPTNTPTPTFAPTWVPQAIPPELVAPAQGETHQNPITFQWSDALNSGQAYQVIAYHSSGNTIQSELLATQSWTRDLPGDLFGEWRWRVSVVAGGREIVTSSEWTFWFDPFPGGGRTQPQPTFDPTPPTATPPP